MSRTKLSPQRLVETKRMNIGHIIIFCEGNTEKYYFEYFSEIIKKNKYTDVEVVLETANGNAQTVLNYAKRFLNDEKNNRKYGNYEKYLVFDCDDPPNIQDVILDASAYQLLISNHLFEVWLLMHFEEIESEITKRQIYQRLTSHLCSSYTKGQEGEIREIIQKGSVEKAIDNAKMLEHKFQADGKNIFSNMKEMIPYTTVHLLVEQLMVEISN